MKKGTSLKIYRRTFLLIFFLAGSLFSQAQSGFEEGAVAPANRWYTPDGCASRTCASLSKPVTKNLGRAWPEPFSVEGEIEGEPLTWDDCIVVEEKAEKADRPRLLSKLREVWRNDLIVVQSKRLSIITPVTLPGSVAKCLSLGELVCDTLEKLFSPFAKVRETRRKLTIVLYECREEYIRESVKAGGGREGSRHLVWTAGHYKKSCAGSHAVGFSAA
jgi:hypothetical protein